jgi:mono/diheme cytochrome c family protein
MRIPACTLAVLITACVSNKQTVQEHATSFDGANYSTLSAKIEHGQRLATIFGCSACHGGDYTGVDFGEIVPVVEGLWATNISLTMPAMSDAQLEKLLRTGVHPSRDEIYLMPSKQTQFLSGRDMGALIAYLRTIPPRGDPTPLPPPRFKEAVGSRLPDDYWRWKPGLPRTYHSSAEEAAYFSANQAPPAGESAELAQGHYIALTVCSGCHGAALGGLGEDVVGIEAAVHYDDAQFNRLLTDSISRDDRELKMEWGFGHEVTPLTESEKAAVIAYSRALARRRVD